MLSELNTAATQRVLDVVAGIPRLDHQLQKHCKIITDNIISLILIITV